MPFNRLRLLRRCASLGGRFLALPRARSGAPRRCRMALYPV